MAHEVRCRVTDRQTNTTTTVTLAAHVRQGLTNVITNYNGRQQKCGKFCYQIHAGGSSEFRWDLFMIYRAWLRRVRLWNNTAMMIVHILNNCRLINIDQYKRSPLSITLCKCRLHSLKDSQRPHALNVSTQHTHNVFTHAHEPFFIPIIEFSAVLCLFATSLTNF